jgi:hypothetical protein
MKTRIELSCTEESLTESLFEVRILVDALNILAIELKVFHDKNRISDSHSWLTVTNKSNPSELYQIYELKKKIRELVDANDQAK